VDGDRTTAETAGTRPLDPRDAHVVACAADLFLREGIEATRMDDVARAAGVGVATLYRHFSTKGRLATEVAMVLWGRFADELQALVSSETFAGLDGLGRLDALLGAYCASLAAHGDFVSFLDEFDHLAVAGKIEREDLAGYGERLEAFFPPFEDAYRLGLEDGSVVYVVDARACYLALAHALMGVAQKMRRGEVIASDDFSRGEEELACIKDMALRSVAARGVPPTSEGV